MVLNSLPLHLRNWMRPCVQIMGVDWVPVLEQHLKKGLISEIHTVKSKCVPNPRLKATGHILLDESLRV